MSGYSGTPLHRKLGLKPGQTVVLLGAPANYTALLGPEAPELDFTGGMHPGAGMVHLFTASRAELRKTLGDVLAVMAREGTIWVSWPKRASKVETDVTEDVIREEALPLGFVDVKVCAIDDTWSGLKLVIRKALR